METNDKGKLHGFDVLPEKRGDRPGMSRYVWIVRVESGDAARFFYDYENGLWERLGVGSDCISWADGWTYDLEAYEKSLKDENTDECCKHCGEALGESNYIFIQAGGALGKYCDRCAYTIRGALCLRQDKDDLCPMSETPEGDVEVSGRLSIVDVEFGNGHVYECYKTSHAWVYKATEKSLTEKELLQARGWRYPKPEKDNKHITLGEAKQRALSIHAEAKEALEKERQEDAIRESVEESDMPSLPFCDECGTDSGVTTVGYDSRATSLCRTCFDKLSNDPKPTFSVTVDCWRPEDRLPDKYIKIVFVSDKETFYGHYNGGRFWGINSDASSYFATHLVSYWHCLPKQPLEVPAPWRACVEGSMPGDVGIDRHVHVWYVNMHTSPKLKRAEYVNMGSGGFWAEQEQPKPPSCAKLNDYIEQKGG